MRGLSIAVVAVLALGCAGARKTAAVRSDGEHALQPSRTRALTAEDIVSLVSVSDAVLSPDGSMIAFVRRTPRTALEGPGGARSIVWIVSVTGDAPVRLTAPVSSSFGPRWSPDGRWLAYQSWRSGDAGAQVYRVSRRGGEPERITDMPSGVARFDWAPDGRSIAFTAKRQPSKRQREAAAAGRDWRTTDVKGTAHGLYVQRVGVAENARRVGSDHHHVSGFAWAPDSRRLVVEASTRADIDGVMMYSKLFLADTEGGWSSLAKTEGKLGSLVWSPDGTRIAFLGAVDVYDPTAGVLHVVDAGGGAARALTADYEGTGVSIAWTRGREIEMLANEGTQTVVYGVDAASGQRTTRLRGSIACLNIGFDAAGKTAVCVGSTSEHPPEVFVVQDGEQPLRLTDSNPWLSEKTLGRQQVVQWTASDGTEIEGVLIHPVGGGADAPLAVLPHGGPEGVSLDDWGTRPTYPAQLFANRGFAVLMPNYRGSQGRGVAFGKANQQDLGGREFEDVLAGIDHLAAMGVVDPDRVGMGGWSYGGYFSGLAATRDSARFKGAMVGAAITNWISFSGTTEIEHETSLVHWKLWPWANMELAWSRSPMAHIEAARTATLVVHGEADTRVPPGQAMELFRGLRHFGVTTELVLYPREGHGLAERAHQRDFAERFVRFFEAHVAGATG